MSEEKKLKDYHNEMREYVKEKALMPLYAVNFEQYIPIEPTEDQQIIMLPEEIVKLDTREIRRILDQLEVHVITFGENHYACPCHFDIEFAKSELTKVETTDDEIHLSGKFSIIIKRNLGNDPE